MTCVSFEDTEPVPVQMVLPTLLTGTLRALPTDTGVLLSPPVAGTFSCTMKFTVRDCDPDTGVPAEEGYDDEYVVSVPCTETL